MKFNPPFKVPVGDGYDLFVTAADPAPRNGVRADLEMWNGDVFHADSGIVVSAARRRQEFSSAVELIRPDINRVALEAALLKLAVQLPARLRTQQASEAKNGAPLTDLGAAERFAARHGGELRYCHDWGKWLEWEGRYWQVDATGAVVRRAKVTAREIYAEAAKASTKEEAAAIAAFARRTEGQARLEAMINLARSEMEPAPGIPVTPDQLDRNPWLVSVTNGTLELPTGELLRHRQTDLITKLVPMHYDPNATCPTWLRFLDQTMEGRQSLIGFLQRAVGYSLTGSIRERALFLLHGSGANGKSTFLKTVAAMLGAYAVRTPTETLLVKREAGIPNDVARLRGARFVYASETEDGKRLAEALIKDMTGGEPLSARFMRGEWFDFTPEFKLWLGTNHKPTIRGTERAIWDRIKLIPFTVSIPEDQQDKELPTKLAAELGGIFAWAVRGCLDWQKNGLGVPDEVKQATAGYRAEMDTLAAFLDDCCVVHEGVSVTAKALYATYTAWCERTGEKAIPQRTMGLKLNERGFTARDLGHQKTRTWLGVGLVTETTPEMRGHVDLRGHAGPDSGINTREITSRSAYGETRPRIDPQGGIDPQIGGVTDGPRLPQCAGCGKPATAQRGGLVDLGGVLLHGQCSAPSDGAA